MVTAAGVTGEVAAVDVTVTATAALSMRAYARRRGTSAVAVMRAIRTGRLKACLVVDDKGKAKIADPALADQEWAANTDLSKAPGYVKERSAGESHAKRQPAKMSLLAEASASEKGWRAKLAELEYREKSGEFVNAKEIEARLVEMISSSRTKLLGFPGRIKMALPELTHAQILVIDTRLREDLEDLAAPPVIAKGSAA